MPDDEPEGPFNVTKTEIECPAEEHKGVMIPIEIGWVNRDYPMLNLNAPELVSHMNQFHHGNN